MYSKEIDRQQLTLFQQRIDVAQHIVLLSHMNADGDACGSILGMTLQLDKVAKSAKSITPILPNGCPRNFTWMPQSERILNGDTDRALCEQRIAEADLIICVDMNQPSRIDFLQEALVNAQCHKVLIDHHHGPDTDNFDIIFSDPDISSTCEYVVWISQQMWDFQLFDTQVARCLYTGLRTDTGGFAFSCSQPSCFEAAAILVKYDINPADVHNRIVNTFSFKRMRFYGFALDQRLKIYPNHKAAMFAFSLDDQQRFGVNGEDMEGLVNYTLMMNDIEVGVLLREEKERTKVSFRAKYNVDVNAMARQLGGGGHTKAAGATCFMPFEQAINEVTNLLNLEGEKPID